MHLTQEQEDAVKARERRICVAAGAGSGKTHVLVQRMVALLRDGVDLDGIVAITFTEKAAAEMKARLHKTFRAISPSDDPKEMSHWRELERRLDTARVSTIHSFCMRLLKEHALRLKLDPDFALLSEPQSRLLARDVVRETLLSLVGRQDPHVMRLALEWSLRSLTETLLKLLPKAGELATATAEWPLLDARMLAQYWREHAGDILLEESHAPGNVREAERLRDALLAFDGRCTAPSKDGRELRRKDQLDALDALLRLPGTAAELLSIGDRVLGVKYPNGSRKYWQDEVDFDNLGAIQEKAGKFFKLVCSLPIEDDEAAIETAELTLALLHVVQELGSCMTRRKRLRNVFDFDDLIAQCADALDSSVEFREHAALEIEHLLLDEFQDTDHLQLAIARSLCGAPGGPSLFVVGDAKQSIYRFRGAEVGVFRDAQREADRVLPLARNFRSAAPILNFVNDSFARAGWLCAVEPEFGALFAERDSLGSPGVEFLVGLPPTGKPTALEQREAEAALIASRITELCAGSPIVSTGKDSPPRQPRPGDFAILLRAMSNVHVYEEALRKAGIPYGVVAGAGFYERQEVIDVLNVFKATLDRFDEPALLGVLRGPFCSLSDDTLVRLCEVGIPLSAAIADTRVPVGIQDGDALLYARTLLADLRSHATLPAHEFIQYLRGRTHFDAVLAGLPNGIQRLSNLRKLADLAEGFAVANNPSLRAFTDYLNDMRSATVREGDALLQPQEAGAVTIMTVHKSKGLEFPIVIVADCSSKLSNKQENLPVHRELGLVLTTPGSSKEDNPSEWKELISRRIRREERDEHARLLYVALTRARDYLIVSGSPLAGAQSWLDMLNREYGVLSVEDGKRLSGAEWHGLVRRRAELHPMPATMREEDGTDWDALFDHMEESPCQEEPCDSISISALLNRMEQGLGDEEDRSQPRDAQGAGRSFALQRGTIVHALFEYWDFGKIAAPVEEALYGLGLPVTRIRELRADLANIAGRFETNPLFLKLRDAKSIVREQPFVLDLGGTLLRGTIDALVDGHTLVDYKTGKYDEHRHERYEWQLRLYAAAARALTGTLPTRGVLAYVDEGETREIIITDTCADEALARARKMVEC